MTPRRHPSAVGIGTASRLTDVEVHTIRYWEEEFAPYLEPIRTEGGQRRYGPEHLLRLHRVRTLLRDEGFTIPGARRRLTEEAMAA